MTRLEALRARPERLVVGLCSGTSLDGIDAALVRFTGAAREDARHEILAYRLVPFAPETRARLDRMASWTVAELCDMNVALGRAFGRAALAVADGAAIDLVGSHGQTVWHRPPAAATPGATLQIGCTAAIAAATGAVVVGDFRSADVAAGGHGAPLAPFLDRLRFGDRPGTVLLNLGGIANLTHVGAAPEDLRAFDCGPANMPLDLVAAAITGGAQDHDAGGAIAASGRVDPELLAHLLRHPFLAEPPPRSTGRELFGADFVEAARAAAPALEPRDLLATLTAFSAAAVGDAVARFLPTRPVRVLVSGGGVHNATLMAHLRRVLAPAPVVSSAEHGLDPDAKEALLFAALAEERLFERPVDLRSVTGARRPALLGSIAW